MVNDYQRGDLGGICNLRYDGPNEETIKRWINEAVWKEEKRREKEVDSLKEEMSRNIEDTSMHKYYEMKMDVMVNISEEKRSNQKIRYD